MGFLKRIGERRNNQKEQTESEPSGWNKLAEEAHPTVAKEEIQNLQNGEQE